jgi:Dolichyl-phosphate-mannose-protein mannosyltransferase
MCVSTKLPWRFLEVLRLGRIQVRSQRTLALACIIVCAAMLLVAAQLYLLTEHQIALDLAAGSREADHLSSGIYDLETDTRGAFRWSDGQSQLRFDQVAQGAARVLELNLGPPPAALVGSPVQIGAGGRSLATIAADADPRRYRILVPADALRNGDLRVDLTSATVVVPPDIRHVGVRLERASVRAIGQPLIWPSAGRVILQTLLLILAALLLAELHLPIRPALSVVILITLGILAIFLRQYLLFTVYIARLAIALTLLLVLTRWALPRLARVASWAGPPRVVRLLWCATLLACGLRLIGVLYPLFSAYDLKLNVERLLSTLTGNLVIIHRAFEFRGGVTVYPPAAYLVLLPGLLVGLAPGLLAQSGIALLDGASVLATGLLARRLGSSPRAALMAALLAAGMPVALTSLYYGHVAQIFGQALMAPLALTILLAFEQPRPRHWLAVGLVLTIALLTHIGVAILAVAWLGLLWISVGLRRTITPANWHRLTLTLALSGVIGALFAYVPVAAIGIAELRSVGGSVLQDRTLPAYNLIARAFWIAFQPLGIMLALPGLLVLRRLPRGGRVLISCWIAVATLFWGIEMVSGLQVRYLVFLAPLVAITVGRLLDRLAQRSTAGRAVAWTMIGLVFVQSSLVWYAGTFTNVAPSMVPLLR